MQEEDVDLFQSQQSITLIEFLPRNFLDDHPKEVLEELEVTTCHAVNIMKVDNNYASFEEVDNSNEIKQRTSVFDRIFQVTLEVDHPRTLKFF
ncbi:hypothetical protein E6C27_scaffold274G005020 [Cucumis melo var. makuwa]|uniref:Uncharacterized protein n=1 Tax=Cucumis melo var. makuwa TaxID=1194695 RepID=A0A5A7UQN4_CUCMM|nr:hypothetical protein E6C27_scaffold274G005020 [Cucumis melo var. makuwa]